MKDLKKMILRLIEMAKKPNMKLEEVFFLERCKDVGDKIQ